MPQLHPHPAGRRVETPTSEAMAASSVVAVLQVSSDGRIVAVNGTLARVLGEADPSGVTGRALREILEPGQDATRLLPSRANGSRDVEIRLSRRDGTVAVLRGDVYTVDTPEGRTAVGVLVDCTELEQLRRSLQRSARLEALASLTGGVAHDFNNLLTVLIGNLSLIAEELRDRPPTFAKLKTARDAARRGSVLISQLLGFAGAEEVETSVIDASDVIRNVVPLLSSALGRRIQLKTGLDSDAGWIDANAAQLESVIVNLAVNARDAIDGRGTVTVSAGAEPLDEAEARARGLEPGDYVRVRVADDGAGIPDELRERVFEPFFSTKRERGGTGLGLSMVRAFAHRHGGRVEIDSRVGEGTAVSVLLPICAETTETEAARTVPLATLPTGDEYIVLVVADTGLCTMMAQILEVLGYTVTSCPDPGELDMVASRQTLDLLICDEPSARTDEPAALVERVRRRHPQLRWIRLVDSKAAAQLAVGDDDGAVLVKPFSLADLASLVRDTLGR